MSGDIVEKAFAGFIRRRERGVGEEKDSEEEERGGEEERPKVGDKREQSRSEEDEGEECKA